MGYGEVEAAEVLASLGGGGVGADNVGWGSKGRRSSNKRVSESESVEFGGYSLPLPFDLNMDQNALHEEECENDDQPSTNVKVEDEYEPAGPTAILRTGVRSKHDISEAEKEARRIRRILANRESARQTIRRRQALYEELKRKSSELASENEDLKRTKKLAVEEFQSLQTTNHNLKDKITQITGLQLGKNSQSQVANNTGIHSVHPPEWHQFLPNSMMPQQANQPGPPGLPFSSEITVLPPFMSNEQGNPIANASQQQTPWCILPYPWLLSLKLSDKDKETLLDTRHVCSPSLVIPPSLCSSRKAPSTVLEQGISDCCLTNSPLTKTEVSRKKSDTGAGAEARRRRREVIKLKSLHYDSAFRRRYGRD
ncbi:uncharacterized protein LOC141649014 [Silene latifolia]|uniref:uncharacterized protein LOC141649014 n=1 Tax=Silene latifolia TaxID=37657 RepID=UPI003D76DF7C